MLHKPFHVLSSFILTLGAINRIIQYQFNRSLWADEAVLALNIVHRSYLEFFQPLDYDQAAPPGFLMIEKLIIELFGNQEYALRAFPLFCGILSLFLFYKFAQSCLPLAALPISCALFANSEFLISYSSEVKQYSTDVAVALLLSLILLPLLHKPLTFKPGLIMALAGAISLWFSYPAVFILAGFGLTSLTVNWFNQKSVNWGHYFSIYLTWLISFILFYFVAIHAVSNDTALSQAWSDDFPESPWNIIWIY